MGLLSRGIPALAIVGRSRGRVRRRGIGGGYRNDGASRGGYRAGDRETLDNPAGRRGHGARTAFAGFPARGRPVAGRRLACRCAHDGRFGVSNRTIRPQSFDGVPADADRQYRFRLPPAMCPHPGRAGGIRPPNRTGSWTGRFLRRRLRSFDQGRENCRYCPGMEGRRCDLGPCRHPGRRRSSRGIGSDQPVPSLERRSKAGGARRGRQRGGRVGPTRWLTRIFAACPVLPTTIACPPASYPNGAASGRFAVRPRPVAAIRGAVRVFCARVSIPAAARATGRRWGCHRS